MEPRVGESLCRLFELAPPPNAEAATTDDEVTKYNEYLASVIAKSKQRHNELASEAESRRRGQTNGEDEDKDKSSNRESKDSTRSSYVRSNGSSNTNGGQSSSSSSSSYRQRDYHQQSSGQSFRLAFPLTCNVNMSNNPHHLPHSHMSGRAMLPTKVKLCIIAAAN